MQNGVRSYQQCKPPRLPSLSSAGDAVPLEHLTDREHSQSMVMEDNNTYLPNEIMVNIFKRLPIKSLIRFQCVCKSWKNLFKDPFLISDHLHHSSHRPSLLLHLGNLSNKPLHLCLFDCELQPREVYDQHLLDYLSSFMTSSYVRIVGSINGLLCLELSDNYCMPPHHLLLWNPVIKEITEVPKTRDFMGQLLLGFGFSATANDYKIIKIYGSGSYYDGNRDVNWGYKKEGRDVNWDYNKGVNKVLLYSLGTGKWKHVEYETLKGVHMYSEAATASNGAIIWVGGNRNGESLLIVSFDIAKEEFTLIPMPSLRPGSTCIPTFYENRVAFLSYHAMMGTLESCFIHLWVIDDKDTCASGERWSWNKKYSGSLYNYPYLLIPINIWRNEIVCTVMLVNHARRAEGKMEEDDREKAEYEEANNDKGRTLCLLNITTNKCKKFVLTYSNFSIGILNYVESLVTVSNIRHNIE